MATRTVAMPAPAPLLAAWRWARAPWRWLRGHVHPVRGLATIGWLAEWTAVRVVWPAVMSAVQSSGWCVRWRHYVDIVAAPGPQLGWAAWVAAGVYFGWWWPLLLPAVVVFAFGAGRLGYRHTARGRARGRYPADLGWATWMDLREGVSAHAVRQGAVDIRPSLQDQVTGRWSGRTSALAVARLSAAEGGTWVGDATIALPWRSPCYASHRDTVCLLAPSQSWKSSQQTHQVIDHPGPVLSTQTKPSTYRQSAALRARRSRSGRVELIDPDGLTGDPSTIRWSPVTGCRDPEVAQQRAGAMVSAAASSGHENQWFVDRAATLLRVLLLVADVAELTMREVYSWAAGGVGDERGTTGLTAAVKTMQRHQRRIPAGWLDATLGVLSMKADKTRDGILAHVGAAVEFMSQPSCASLCLPGPDDAPFDIRQFLDDSGTVYLIAEEREHASAGPLLAAFTDYVFQEAKAIAGRRPNERLDPPLHLSLDEVCNTIRLPLNVWLTDSLGRGIQIAFSAQSRSQFTERWGEAGARTVWNAATVKLIGGGITDEQDLRALSELCGDRVRWNAETGKLDRTPKLTPEELRLIPPWTALLIHRYTPVTLTALRPVWRRPDVLASRLLGQVPRPTPMPLTLTAVPDEPAVAIEAPERDEVAA